MDCKLDDIYAEFVIPVQGDRNIFSSRNPFEKRVGQVGIYFLNQLRKLVCLGMKVQER